jgi:DNA-directed RNA polymerase specialized sigma24 family protein
MSRLPRSVERSGAAGRDRRASEDLGFLQRALLDGNPEAREGLASRLIAVLTRALRSKMSRVDPTIIAEAVEDTVLEYIAKPASYDPHKASLVTFLVLAATRNALDALRAQKRRRVLEERSLVEFAILHDGSRPDGESVGRTLDLFAATKTDAERRFLAARLEGEHRTEVLAELLGATSLSQKEQRSAVKRCTERLRMRWIRLASGQTARRGRRAERLRRHGRPSDEST